MKLTIQEIEEVCLIANGFTFEGWHIKAGVLCPSGLEYILAQTRSVPLKIRWEHEIYPLLLTRAIEGFNEEDNVAIVIFKRANKEYWAFDCSDEKYCIPMTCYATPDEAREEAIRHILKQRRIGNE